MYVQLSSGGPPFNRDWFPRPTKSHLVNFVWPAFEMAQHKPGSLKQKNKKHKGKDGKRAQNKVMGAGKVNATVRKSAKSNAQKDL